MPTKTTRNVSPMATNAAIKASVRNHEHDRPQRQHKLHPAALARLHAADSNGLCGRDAIARIG